MKKILVGIAFSLFLFSILTSGIIPELSKKVLADPTGCGATCAAPTGWPPMGHLDAVTCDSFGGWAGDLDNNQLRILVHFYDENAVLIAVTMTGGDRPDVAPNADPTSIYNWFGSPNIVGYNYAPINPSVVDTNNHTISAFARNIDSLGNTVYNSLTPKGYLQQLSSPRTLLACKKTCSDGSTVLKTASCPLPGCTIAGALNYNAAATVDNGTCTKSCPGYASPQPYAPACPAPPPPPPVLGCTIAGANNFNALANKDDGSCNKICPGYASPQPYAPACPAPPPPPPVLGCTIAGANNFNALANKDDGSCNKICPGYASPQPYTPACPAPPPAPVPGCMSISANNFNKLATVDNGSCTYDPVIPSSLPPKAGRPGSSFWDIFFSTCKSQDPANTSDVNASVCVDRNVSQTNSCNDIFGKCGIISKIITIISWVVGVASVAMAITGGLKYVASAGDPQQAATARRTLLFAVIGVVIVILAQGIITFVFNRL